jgi:hypothetical protein
VGFFFKIILIQWMDHCESVQFVMRVFVKSILSLQEEFGGWNYISNVLNSCMLSQTSFG